jgi:hypothetical protein
MHDLIRRESIEELCKHRDNALALYGEAWEAIDRASREVVRAAPSARFAMPGGRYRGSSMIDVPDSKDAFLKAMRPAIDRAVWSHLMGFGQFETIMDKAERDKFRAGMEGPDVPEATPENCFATFQGLVAQSGEIFRRGIANAFSGLDRRFRSHDGFKIGSRVVLTYFHREGYCYGSDRVCETIRDIEKTFRILDGKAPKERGDDITAKANSAMSSRNPQCVVEDEYFKLRAFKNGNAHLWFKRDDLLLKVNALLAEYYGEALGDASGRDSDTRHPYKTGLAKNLGFFPTPEPVAKTVAEAAGLYRAEEEMPLRILEPSAGEGALIRAACAAHSRWLPSFVAVEVDRGRAQMLAGDPVCERVLCSDFLGMTPDHIGMFDRVLMNPPFDGGRDMDHVRHASKFLKPGGRLVAIMSAGVEFREDAKTVAFRELVGRMKKATCYAESQWRDLPAGSFKESGTNVNACIVILDKPKEG